MITELIEKLNNEKIHQTCFFEDQEELQDFLDNWLEVENELDVDKHRWYELSTSVFTDKETKTKYIGICHITNQYSEQSSYEDHYHHYKFFEMEPVQTITYKRK